MHSTSACARASWSSSRPVSYTHLEKIVNPGSEYLKELPNHIRTYEQALAYLPNQAYIDVYKRQGTEGVGAQAAAEPLMYGIGSTSKVVTAAAVMRLADEGKLDLKKPLITYIPEFEMADERYRRITPEMLLDHSSGLPGSTLNNAMLLGDSDTENHDMLLARLKKQRLKSEMCIRDRIYSPME